MNGFEDDTGRQMERERSRGNNRMATFFQSNLFIFLLGQFCMFAFWLLGFAVTYGETKQRDRDLDQWRAGIDATIKRIDEQGTNYAKYTLQSNTNQIQVNTGRLTKVEDEIRRVDVLQEKVNRLDDSLKQHVAQPHGR